MNKKAILASLLLAALSAPAMAQVGVSVNIGQPGFYGQINIGDFPQPQVIYSQPVIIQQPTVVGAPVYLRVPPGHERNWGKHCRRYNACGRPVYFVRDDWYSNVYAPQYRERHGHDHDDHHGDGDDHGRGRGRGKGRGHGEGHGHGHDHD